MFEKTFAKCKTMRYNHFRVGAWCSGSTWASDSHGVGSIPIAPANALHPREKRGCIFMPARLGLPKRGRGIKITPRKRCKALNPPKGADGSPRRGYYYGSCPSICVFVFLLHTTLPPVSACRSVGGVQPGEGSLDGVTVGVTPFL